MKTVDFSETIPASDLKVGRCRQLIEIMKVCKYWRSRSFLKHMFSRFCMFCALLGQDIRLAFTVPLVLWFIIMQLVCAFVLVYVKSRFSHDAEQMMQPNPGTMRGEETRQKNNK